MSLRSRARNVQRAAHRSYQQAVAALRALGDKPAALAERYGWSLSRADLYLVDRSLDTEYREVAALGALVVISRCAECKRGFFLVVGSGESACPVHRGSRDEQVLRRGCEEVRARCDALAVAVVLRDGKELAWAGERDALVRTAVREAMRELTWAKGEDARLLDVAQQARLDAARVMLRSLGMSRAPPGYTVIEMRGGTPSTLLLAQVGDAAAVAVHFDGRTSLAMAAVTLEPLLDLLAKRLREVPLSPGWPPGGGGRGPSGAGANAWEVRPFLEEPAGETVEPLDAPRRRSRPS
jgi:hypothetical protein